jgi:hypothetical protein
MIKTFNKKTYHKKPSKESSKIENNNISQMEESFRLGYSHFKYVHRFNNPLINRTKIRIKLKGKQGIYCWLNKINNKAYVGSSKYLGPRFSDYFEPAYIKTYRNRSIVRAMQKYGIENFDFII